MSLLLIKHIQELIEEHKECDTLVGSLGKEIGKLKEQNKDYTNQIDKCKQERDVLLKYPNGIEPFYKERIDTLNNDLNRYKNEIV